MVTINTSTKSRVTKVTRETKTTRATKEHFRSKRAMIQFAKRYGLREAGRVWHVCPNTVSYWLKKFSKTDNPGAYGGGGVRYLKYDKSDVMKAIRIVRDITVKEPMSSLAYYVKKLREKGLAYSKSWVSNIIYKLGKSFKVACYKSKLKYTAENINRYLQYVEWMQRIVERVPLYKIKFLDESHCTSRHLYRKKGVATIGKRLIVINNTKPLDYSFSLTLLTTLDRKRHPVVGSLRQKSNTQLDFLTFICECVESGYLKRGDVLIMDNASVHGGKEIFVALMEMAEAAGFQIFFLPTYSPELNPCEGVHSQQQRDGW